MRPTTIMLDRLTRALEAQGVRLKRSQILETCAAAFGYHNSHEMTAAAKAGDLTPPEPDILGRVDVGDDALVVIRDPLANAIYGVDEAFVEQAIGLQKSETFGTSPFGHLLNLGGLMSRPIPTIALENAPAAPRWRYSACRHDGTSISEHDDLEVAKQACLLDAGRYDVSAYVIDHIAHVLMRASRCWREEPLPLADGAVSAYDHMAAQVLILKAQVDDLESQCESLVNLAPDWVAWERDLKKASRHNQGPIDDEMLLRFRHAVADNRCKSSESERSTVRYRQARFSERHLGGLLARLDHAEDALAAAGLRPEATRVHGRNEAIDILAAIEAMATSTSDKVIPGLYEISATRNGATCHERFKAPNGEAALDKAREIVIAEFSFTAELETLSDEVEAECDTFTLEPVHRPAALAILQDLCSELSGLDHGELARIKLLAAIDLIGPKPTID